MASYYLQPFLALITSGKLAIVNTIGWQCCCFFLRFYSFSERGREGKREGEKHQCVVASCTPTTGDLACNPGMCPYWESNQLPFSSQTSAQSTEPHQPGAWSQCLKVVATELCSQIAQNKKYNRSSLPL